MRTLWSLVLSTFVISGVAFASGGSKPEPTSSEPSTSSDPSMPSSASDGTATKGLRGEAEQSYALAYDEYAKAKKDLDAGKTKNAAKKLKKALERADRAVTLDANYHEAWNLIGYCSRKLGDYDKAFAAYDKCLAIKPDYAPAREYLGEAWLEKGDVTKAREQLSMLEKSGETGDEAGRLTAAIQTYEKAHPEAAASTQPATETPATATATPDSTGNH
jgi:tetratricopeptide (TPR) repeat protein